MLSRTLFVHEVLSVAYLNTIPCTTHHFAMGCCTSSPHSRRKYRDPADLDEVVVPLREFGNYRNGTTNLVPDDIDGLPSTHNYKHLASDPDTLL